mgnify:CR=1 FL=1
METIRLYRKGQSWIADYGAHEIITSFTSNVSVSVVLSWYITRYPGTDIFVDLVGIRGAVRNEGPGVTPAPLASAKIIVALESGHCEKEIKA